MLAPDQRGYGGSSRPEAVEAYDITALTGDVVGLLDDVGAERAAMVGHDFGAVVAWNTPLLHPDRVAAVAGLAVPPIPRPQTPPTEAFRRIFGDNFFYILYFQQPGPADAELAADPAPHHAPAAGRHADTRRTRQAALRMLTPGPAGFLDRLTEPDRLPDWLLGRRTRPLRRGVRSHRIHRGARTGTAASTATGTSWANPVAETITVPALFVGGTDDPTLGFTRIDRAGEVVKGPYRQVLLDGAGHWIQQERPDEINRELVEFLSGLEF